MSELDLKQIREISEAFEDAQTIALLDRLEAADLTIEDYAKRIKISAFINNRVASKNSELEKKLAERDAKIMDMLEANMRMVKLMEERDAQLKVCVEALKEIGWSNDTSWQSDRAKEALEKLEVST